MNGRPPLRLAVVGVGANVVTMHAPALRSPRVAVVGVCDLDLDAARRRAADFACPAFADHRAMLDATRPEAVVVVAPHPFHAPLAIDCLAAGAHVLVEKPVADQVAEADRMVDAAARAGRLLAVSLQQRTRPEVRTAKRLVAEGHLGEIQRVEMVAIWTRTARYYAQAGWRGTWRGEGGGVLMNQAPHNIDLVCHLAGQPRRVVAWNRAQFHAIETEDTSAALLEWSNGALGTLLVSTAQAGDPERLEVAGTRGLLRLSRGGLEVLGADQDLRDFLASSPEPFGKFPLHPRPAVVDGAAGGDHAAIYANFLDAIEHGARLVADGAEARLSLELANALTLSSHTGRQVDLPLDRDAYASLLARLRAAADRPTGGRREPAGAEQG